MWELVGFIVKLMSVVMQGQLEQNRKFEGEVIFNYLDGFQGKYLFLLLKLWELLY